MWTVWLKRGIGIDVWDFLVWRTYKACCFHVHMFSGWRRFEAVHGTWRILGQIVIRIA